MAGPLSALDGQSKSGSGHTYTIDANLVYPYNLGDTSDGSGYFVMFDTIERKTATLDSKAPEGESTDKVVKTGSISLYMPTAPQVQYGTQWSAGDIGAAGAAALAAFENGDDATKEAAATYLKTGVGTYANKALELAAGAVNTDTGKNALNFSRKAVKNNEARMLFQGVDFRQFTFEYTFSPKNMKETENVKKILNTFKKNMLPKRQSNFNLLTYPNEFQIEYFAENGPNEYLHKFKPSALVNMSINYGPNGSFATFMNGAPVEMTVTLTFQELTFLTQEDIEGEGDFNF